MFVLFTCVTDLEPILVNMDRVCSARQSQDGKAVEITFESGPPLHVIGSARGIASTIARAERQAARGGDPWLNPDPEEG